MNRLLGRTEEALVNFSMERARDQAWSVAKRLVALEAGGQDRAIAALDSDVAAFGRVIRHAGIAGSVVTRVIRLGERGSIARKIDVLR